MKDEFKFEDKGYKATLADGRTKIFIDNWPVEIALSNITLASRLIGPDYVREISKLDKKSAIMAVMNAKDHKGVAEFISHCCTCVVYDGVRITAEIMDTKFEGKLHEVIELFTHVLHSQYDNFFAYGLAEVSSPETSTATKPQA